MFLPVDQGTRIKGGYFKSVPVGDGIRRTRLYAVSAENAAVVIDVVNFGITLGATDPMFRSIFSCFDINAVRWTGGRTKEAGDALFKSVLVTL